MKKILVSTGLHYPLNPVEIPHPIVPLVCSLAAKLPLAPRLKLPLAPRLNVEMYAPAYSFRPRWAVAGEESYRSEVWDL